MRVYEASTLISAEFGGIRDLSRHLSLNFITNLPGSGISLLLRAIKRPGCIGLHG